jgi:methyl-accepting chemotaxis protein
MTTPATTAQAPVGTDHRPVPAQARQLAARLSALFDRDVEIVKRLNDAHQHLANANQQLDARAEPDTLKLTEIRRRIHHAFCAYQDAAEQRRQLAVDVGEIAQQLTDTLTQAGWTTRQARRANVHQLAAPSHPQGGEFP